MVHSPLCKQDDLGNGQDFELSPIPTAHGSQAGPHCSDDPEIQLISAWSLSLKCTPKMYPRESVILTPCLGALCKPSEIKWPGKLNFDSASKSGDGLMSINTF